MYEAIFQTTDRPFRATPDERFYFPYDCVEQARQTLARVVRRAEGPAMVMGGSGLGKTMLAQIVGKDLSDLFDVVKLHATRLCSRRALLQSILFELQLPYRELSEGELRMSLMNRMERSPDYAPNGLLLMVDEAHTLPVKLLEELRLITNFARGGEPRARLILVGNLALEDTFARPQLESFNQRLAARCYLQPMNRQQTHGFIAHQLRCIGAEPNEVITRDGMEVVYAASEGIPRLANQVMDHSLVLAITSGQSPISAALVEEAWSDLQQLPAPWHGTPVSSPAAPIEFGSLEDDDNVDEPPAEVGLSLPSKMHFEQLPAVMPVYQFYDLGIRDLVQSGVDPDSGNRHLSELEQTHQGFNFFDNFEDIGHSLQHESEQKQGLAAQTHVETSAFIFTEVEESVSLLAPKSRPVEPTLAPAANTSEQTSEANEYEMLVIHEDRPGDFERFANADGMMAGHWDFSQAFWNALSDSPSDAESIRAAQNALLPLQAPPKSLSFDPFGTDFDEEFSIESQSPGLWASQRKVGTTKSSPESAASFSINPDSVANREQEALDQIAQLQHSLDSFQQGIEARPDMVFQGMDYSIPTPSDQEHVWQVDTAGSQVPTEEVLHEEIEDLISQLNFSAFSIEPESVEQISIDYMRVAAPAPIHVFDRAQGENDPPIYSMHEPAPEDTAGFFDDDRELLVVEEDIPLSMRLSSMPTAPTRTEAQSYSQLFTKLRN